MNFKAVLAAGNMPKEAIRAFYNTVQQFDVLLCALHVESDADAYLAPLEFKEGSLSLQHS